jgi:hypothetical protein
MLKKGIKVVRYKRMIIRLIVSGVTHQNGVNYDPVGEFTLDHLDDIVANRPGAHEA